MGGIMVEQRRSLLPYWVVIWLIASTVLCTLDIIYTMLRPHTVRGGTLETVYELWNIYADVDFRYADPKDLVTMATGRVMVFEIILNVIALALNQVRSRHAVLTTFTTSAFVFWKTIWYLALFINTPEGTPSFLNEDASFARTFFVFWVADGIWVVFPLLVMVVLWNRLARPEYVECCRDERIVI